MPLRKIIRINYTKAGQAVPDEYVEEFIKQNLNTSRRFVSVSTSNIIDAARSMITEGKLKFKEIEIYFNGENLNMDENLRFEKYPDGFCDHFFKWSLNILKYSVKKHKNKMNLKPN